MMRLRSLPARCRSWIAFAAIVALSGHAEAQEQARRKLDWTPSLALGVLAHGQSASADASTSWTNCSPTITPGSNTPGCFTAGRPPASGSPSLTTGVPDLRIALVGPKLDVLSDRVRPFVHGGWQYGWLALDTEVIAAQEGDLGQLIFPAGTNRPSNVAGIGTETTTDVKNGWFAGLGLAVDIPWAGYDLRLLPSIDYYGERIGLEGTSRRVAELVTPIASTFDKAEFRVEETSGKSSKVMHAIGPRVALEADLGRSGSLVVSGFIEVGVFFFLNDRELIVRATGDGTGVFSVEKDAVTAHGGAGIRFYWRPE